NRAEAEARRAMDEVHIRLDKLAGEEKCHRDIQANSTDALLMGLVVLVMETAKLLNVSVERVLCILTATMLAPEIEDKEEQK
ncbi:MAG: hypothetical protein IJZ66_02210, partial [Oscillibacter sp.]|nr:hypothetical protein [Oscillibacter sp.]